MNNILKFMCFIIIIISFSYHSSFAQIKVVNLIPSYYSGESGQDAEPNLAVNPVHPRQMAVSAFTPNNTLIPKNPNPDFAPIYISTDGGDNWDYRFIIPDNDPAIGKTDITIRFGGNSNKLYAGTLTKKTQPHGEIIYEMDVLGIPDINSTDPSNTKKLLSPARQFVDQPYIQAASVLRTRGRLLDRVYVGINDNFDLNNPHSTNPPYNKATVEFSLDAFKALPVFDVEEVDKPLPPSTLNYHDESGIRTAIHPSGIIYTVFYRINSLGTKEDVVNVMVVRDDHWASNTRRFEDLTQSMAIGQPVATNVIVPVVESCLGRNRLIGSHLSIAVDPNNAAVVYVAWADKVADVYTLHVQKSSDFGQSWPNKDLIAIPDAINPALAVNTNGKIAFLYQQMFRLAGDNRWETHLRRFADGDISWSDDILSTFQENSIAGSDPNQSVYLGDYLHLMAVGKDFYGVFSASNDPNTDNATFPNGLIYQRSVDRMRKVLLDDKGATVDPSIDPFFFHVTELEPSEDFYVRDFTNSIDFDEGLEPSIEPRFCTTSDVWNRRVNSSGAYNSDGPENLDPQLTSDGHNFVFSRIRRKNPAPIGTPDKPVTVQYYYAIFGTGTNFIPIQTPITLPFSPSETDKTTAGLQWDLPSASTNHICMAVEISTDNDPFIGNSLDQHAPGWNTGTDLLIINDNNRAQRNMNLYEAPATSGTPTPPGSGTSGTGTMSTATAVMYALIHNPTLEMSDIHLKPVIDPIAMVRPSVTIIGGKEKQFIAKPKGEILLKSMKPGEARFLKISYVVPKGKEGKSFSLTYNQVKNEVVVNAFTIVNKYSSMDKIIKENLRYEAGVFGRINALYKEMDTALLMRKNNKNVFETEPSPKDYLKYLKESIPMMRSLIRQLISMKNNDLFELKAALNLVEQRLKSNDAIKSANAHLSLLNTIDAYLTSLQLEKGNAADILQTVYLQRETFRKLNKKKENNFANSLITGSGEFIQLYESKKLSINDYPAKIKNMLPDLRAFVTQNGLSDERFLNSLKAIEDKLNDPIQLQGEHIKFLLLLREISGN